jgi:glycosyltransferase involved in cell wall biosynthesis
LTFHSPVLYDTRLTRIENLYTVLINMQTPVSYLLESQNIKRSSVISAVSPWVAESIKNYPHIHGKIKIMWNGVDTTIFRPPINDRRELSVLYVGRLVPGKGLFELIDSARIVIKKNPDIFFWIIGDGILRSPIERKIAKYGLINNILLFGHISNRQQLSNIYQRAGCFILPSFHESLPTVILEAMSCGCSVIATSVGGIPDVITDRVNGILVPPRNPYVLASSILELLNNPEISKTLGRNARDTVIDRFSWEKIVSLYIQTYNQML